MNNTLSLCRDHKKKLAATESKLAALQKKQRVNSLRQIGACRTMPTLAIGAFQRPHSTHWRVLGTYLWFSSDRNNIFTAGNAEDDAHWNEE